MILSAGLGTRLRPLSSWRAKPLVPVGDRPALAHIVDVVRSVARVVVVNAHHRADEVARFAEGEGLLVSREDELLGTGGGLWRAAPLLGGGDVLVWNGDMLGDLDPVALAAFHAASGAVATLVVRPRTDLAGNTGLDAGGDVVRLRRATCRDGEAASADFLGIYVLSEELRASLPNQGDVIDATLLPALRRGAKVAVFSALSPFLDIGTPASYLEANLRWLAGRASPSWVGAGASVAANARLSLAVVGEGARVEGAGDFAECIVWPGGRAKAPMRRAIVAPEGTVFT